MITERAMTDVPHPAEPLLNCGRAFAGYLVWALVGCMPFLVSELSYASRVEIETYELMELERDKHSELPTDLRTVLFDIGIINESDRPGDLIVNYREERGFTFYVVKRSECQESRCLTGFYYKMLLTFDRKYLEQSPDRELTWLKGNDPFDELYLHIEPLAGSYVFFGKCNSVQSLKSSPSWGSKLLLLVECLAAKDTLEGTPFGTWLTKRGPSINKHNVLPK